MGFSMLNERENSDQLPRRSYRRETNSVDAKLAQDALPGYNGSGAAIHKATRGLGRSFLGHACS